MKKWLPTLLLLLSPCMATAAERVDAVLEDFRLHGYHSPEAALKRLESASDVPVDDSAPAKLRQDYYVGLANLGMLARDQEVLGEAVGKLDAMARTESCSRCAAWRLLILTNDALNRRDATVGSASFSQLDALIKKDDDELQQALRYTAARWEDVRGNQSAAVLQVLPALRLAEKMGNEADRFWALILLGGLYADLGYVERASAVAVETLSLASAIGFHGALGAAHLNEGYVARLKGDEQQALRAWQDAVEASKGAPSLTPNEVVARSNISDVYLGLGEYERARNEAVQAAVLARRIDDELGLFLATANEGIALTHLGQESDGIAQLRKSLAMAIANDNPRYAVLINEELVAALERSGRYKEALSAVHDIAEINEEVTRQNRERAVMELQTQYDSERKTREIERLSAANRLNEAKVAARNLQQWLWAALAAVLGLAAVVMWQWLKSTHRLNRRLKTDNRSLAKQTEHDALTGAFNRRYCLRMLDERKAAMLVPAHSRDRDYRACTGLILLDIDHFKQVNDQNGHAAGDAVLVEVAHRLQALVREQDAVIRWGGEEFVLVLPGTPPDGLAILMDRLLNAIGRRPVALPGASLTVTVSAGAVAYPFFAGQQWEEAIQLADSAMYLAKQRGRNRGVCLMEVVEDAAQEVIRGDLAEAEEAGLVRITTLLGPGASVPETVPA